MNPPRPRNARIAISIGCPSGIGPEVSLAAADGVANVVLVGDHAALLRAAKARGIAPERIVRVDEAERAFEKASKKTLFVWQPTANLRACDARPGKPTPAAGAAQLAWVDAACDLASAGRVDAMVTGPVSKEIIVASGAPGSKHFRGHTEHLQERLRAREVVMAFAAEALTTALVTTHLALSAVPRAISPARVATAAYWLGVLVTDLAERGKKLRPIAIAALNPHAGEGGLFGSEEARAITPGIELARERLKRDGRKVLLQGPIPAESAFRHAMAGRYEAVLAMYHDQATIPQKLAGFGEAVNVSLGLPIIRTSVDHGTAYDIAYRNVADPRGMHEALSLAQRLATVRRR